MQNASLWHRARRLVFGLIIGILGAGLILGWRYGNLPLSRVLVNLEFLSYNFRANGRAGVVNAKRDQDCVIVAIDESSIKVLSNQYGLPWPWTRDVHARLTRLLADAGAAVIAFDVTFDSINPAPNQEPDPDDYFWQPEPSDEDKDFADAIAQAGNVVLATLITETIVENMGQMETLQEGAFPGWLFDDAAAAKGDADVAIDSDDVVRRTWLTRTFQDETIASLPVVASALYKGISIEEQLAQSRADLSRSLQDDGSFWIDYHGSVGDVPTYSYSQVLEGQPGPEAFKDKIVLIGATAEDLQDIFPVPVASGGSLSLFSLPMPGVEVHANTIRTLLAGETLRPSPIWVTVIVTLLLGCLTGVVTLHLRPLPTLLTYMPAALVAFSAACLYLFAVKGIWANMTLPLVGSWLGTYLASTVFAYLTVERERKHIEAAWGKRVSPEILQRILADPELRQVQGRTIDATVLFSDLRGFTTLCHSWHPEEVVRRLNEIFNRMTRVITGQGGNIDKYIGDGIMAVFGDPIPMDDHARRATLAAVAMLREMEQLQAEAEARGDQPIRMGVGVHSGPLVAGDIGSEDHLEYTAIGDTVSTASRLEGLNKEYSTEIIISGDTHEQAGDDIPSRLLETTTVRGRETPLQVYEVLWKKGLAVDDDRAEE